MAKKTVQGLWLGLIAASVLILAGCPKEVVLTPEGKKVEFMENQEVIKDKLADKEQCKLVVSLKITGQGSMNLVGEKKLKEENDRLVRARNAAAREGANVIVKVGELEGRTQSFDAFNCKT